MTSTLPTWITYLQALSTPAIAVLAAVIGIMQWRTAHQRAVQDLFDKRYDAYNRIRSIIVEVVTDGTTDPDRRLEFLRRTDRAQFLFGSEVTEYFATVYQLLAEHEYAESLMKEDGDKHEAGVRRQEAAHMELTQFLPRSLALVRPFMRMHQKAPPW
jgi:hypothetical protein